MRRCSASTSRARISMSVAWPWKPDVQPWWIITLLLGSAIRLPCVPPASRIAPIDMAMPKQIVETSGRMKRIAS